MLDIFDGLFDGLAWLLNFFYTLVPSYGVAIILLTVAVYTVAFPLTAKSTRSMAAMGKLQPELQKIKQRYPDDRQKQSEETFALMKEHGTSPFGGCLPLLVQMPVFFIMYQLLFNLTRMNEAGTQFNPKYLADGSTLKEALTSADGKMVSFGLDLAKTASEVLSSNFVTAIPFLLMIVGLVGTGYFQQYQISRRNPQQQASDNPYAQQMQRMTKIMPLMYLFFGFAVPAGVVLYLLVSNTFRIVQQTLIYRFDPSLKAPVGAKLHEERAEDATSGEAATPAKPAKEAKPAKDATPSSGNGRDAGNAKRSPNGSRRPPGRAQPKKKSRKKGR